MNIATWLELPYQTVETIANNASISRSEEPPSSGVTVSDVQGGGGAGVGGKPISPPNVVEEMANARIVAAKRFFTDFMFSSWLELA